MDSLPDEVLGPLILGKHLNVRDLVRCKGVSKRWWWVIQNLVQVRELVLSDKIDEFPKGIWYYSNKPIEYENALESAFLKRDRLNLSYNLRRLHLGYYCNPKLSEYLDLSAFEHLEQLDIVCEIDCRRIASTSLKVFSCLTHGVLLLQTPNLQVLKCQDLDLILLSDPKRLKQLELSDYSEKIESLTGLEHLQLNYEGVLRLDRDILQSLKLLKCLKLNPACAAERPDEFREFRNNVLLYIVKQKLVLRRTELHIFLFGVELTNSTLVGEYDPTCGKLAFQIANYDSVFGDLSCHQSVDYKELLCLFRNQIREDYFKKFINIRQVILHGEPDDSRFVAFLSKLDHFESLHLTDESFVQSSLDRLPDLCSKLTELRIEQHADKLIDYAFVLRFRLLRRFFTTQNSSNLIDMAIQCARQLTYLQSFVYHKKLSSYYLLVTIMKKMRNRFHFVSADQVGPSNMTVDIQPNLRFDDLVKAGKSLKESIADGPNFFFLFIGTGK